jgi:DNA-binding transcriptional ArsR family regulator
MMLMDPALDLDATFAALAHPTRRAILARLAKGEATVNEIAAPFEMSLPAISKHIRVLEGANLIRRGRNAQFRPCTINAAPLAAVAQWADAYRHIWDDRFDVLDDILNDITPTGGNKDD